MKTYLRKPLERGRNDDAGKRHVTGAQYRIEVVAGETGDDSYWVSSR